jgi:hypothetical protein
MSFIVNSSKSPLTKEDYLSLRMNEKGLFKNPPKKKKQTNKQTNKRKKQRK